MTSELASVVAEMRRLGVVRYKWEGREIELTPTAPMGGQLAEPPAPELPDLLRGPPEGDDALFWSTTGPLPSEIRSADKPPEE